MVWQPQATGLWLKIPKFQFIKQLYLWWLLHWGPLWKWFLIAVSKFSSCLQEFWHDCSCNVISSCHFFGSWANHRQYAVCCLLTALSKAGQREVKGGWAGAKLFSGGFHLLFFPYCYLGMWCRLDTSLQGGWGEVRLNSSSYLVCKWGSCPKSL